MMLSVLVFGDHYSVDPFDVAEVKLFFNDHRNLDILHYCRTSSQYDFTNYKLQVLFACVILATTIC